LPQRNAIVEDVVITPEEVRNFSGVYLKVPLFGAMEVTQSVILDF
jgi:hypothetical protein